MFNPSTPKFQAALATACALAAYHYQGRPSADQGRTLLSSEDAGILHVSRYLHVRDCLRALLAAPAGPVEWQDGILGDCGAYRRTFTEDQRALYRRLVDLEDRLFQIIPLRAAASFAE